MHKVLEDVFTTPSSSICAMPFFVLYLLCKGLECRSYVPKTILHNETWDEAARKGFARVQGIVTDSL